MQKLTNPTDIARETLKLLTARRLVPTPENYQKLYQEISGAGGEVATGIEPALQKVFKDVVKNAPGLKQPVHLLEKAFSEKNWVEFELAFSALATGKGVTGSEKGSWGTLIKDLLKQWELKHSGITSKRKREGVDRVLANFSADSVALQEKLGALVRSWSEMPKQSGIEMDESLAEAEVGKPESTSIETKSEVSRQSRSEDQLADIIKGDAKSYLQELLVQSLELGLMPRLTHFPELMEEAGILAKRAREARDELSFQGLSKDLKQFWFKLEVRGESDSEVLAGIMSLLRLLVDNVGELVIDDQWLHGQVAVIQGIIAQPLDTRSLFDAERSFKEVIYKQSALKHSLNDAKTTLKNMLTTFVDRLGELSESTDGYQSKIEGYSVKISQTEDILQLNKILEELLVDTKGMQLDVMRSRDELIEARKQVEAAEQKIIRLEVELDEVSELVREDQLTGTLNRRGMDDAFERELARSDRVKSKLSVAVLDVDHFKRLNDSLGHQAGDEALIHLVRVVKEALRPTDTIARYGGEEFVIILPDTPVDEAVKVMTRVQRELTKKFFLHKNERVLITFSAGIAERLPDEGVEPLIGRADKAVYAAKEAGRNRVEVA